MAAIDLTRSIPGAQPAPFSYLGWTLSAVQHIRRLKGRTQAHLMRASDGELYAVKFQNHPGSARALASEFLATRLGLWLGLPMPQVEVIEVSEWLVNHDLLRIETDDGLTRCASGRQLGLRYARNAVPVMPKKLFEQVTNRHDFIQVVAFDKWTGNCDNRQAVFVWQKKGRYRALFIDQHNCFNASRWTFPDLAYHGAYAQAYVYEKVTGWHWFDPALSRIEKISRFDLWKIATEIPPEWYQHDSAGLCRLVERLYKRRLSRA